MVINPGLDEFQIFTIPKLSKLETHLSHWTLRVNINDISFHVNGTVKAMPTS